MIDDPHRQGQQAAEQKTGDHWKIKTAGFALVGDVSGQAAEAKRQFASGEEKQTGQRENGADDDERFSEIAERFGLHGRILRYST
jgi:hypothetical protein